MDPETIEGLVAAYALGAADPEESRTVEAHLEGCAGCRALLAEYRSLGEDLLYAVPPMAAPVGMAERMRGRLEPPRSATRRESRLAWLRLRPAAFIVGAAMVLLVATNLYWFGRVRGLEQRAASPTSSFSWLSSSAGIPLRADGAGSRAQGVVYAPRNGQNALLCVYDMPTLPSDKTYQLWLTQDGKRDSGGLFQVSPAGFGLLVIRAARPLSDYSALGITVEPAGGSPGPTSPRVLGGNL